MGSKNVLPAGTIPFRLVVDGKTQLPLEDLPEDET